MARDKAYYETEKKIEAFMFLISRTPSENIIKCNAII